MDRTPEKLAKLLSEDVRTNNGFLFEAEEGTERARREAGLRDASARRLAEYKARIAGLVSSWQNKRTVIENCKKAHNDIWQKTRSYFQDGGKGIERDKSGNMIVTKDSDYVKDLIKYWWVTTINLDELKNLAERTHNELKDIGYKQPPTPPLVWRDSHTHHPDIKSLLNKIEKFEKKCQGLVKGKYPKFFNRISTTLEGIIEGNDAHTREEMTGDIPSLDKYVGKIIQFLVDQANREDYS